MNRYRQTVHAKTNHECEYCLAYLTYIKSDKGKAKNVATVSN